MNAHELKNQLRSFAHGALSIADFDEWFGLNSWNVHRHGNQKLIDAVFEIEELLSAYSDFRVSIDDLRQACGNVAENLVEAEFENHFFAASDSSFLLSNDWNEQHPEGKPIASATGATVIGGPSTSRLTRPNSDVLKFVLGLQVSAREAVV